MMRYPYFIWPHIKFCFWKYMFTTYRTSFAPNYDVRKAFTKECLLIWHFLRPVIPIPKLGMDYSLPGNFVQSVWLPASIRCWSVWFGSSRTSRVYRHSSMGSFFPLDNGDIVVGILRKLFFVKIYSSLSKIRCLFVPFVSGIFPSLFSVLHPRVSFPPYIFIILLSDVCVWEVRRRRSRSRPSLDYVSLMAVKSKYFLNL